MDANGVGTGTRPVVAAVLGRHGEDDVRRLAEASGLPAEPWLHLEDRLTVLADATARPAATSRAVWTLRGVLPEAQVGPDAAWAGTDGARVVVRGDEAGLLPLLYRQVGDRLLVASSIGALVAAADGPLHVDWQAWGDLLQLGYPIEGRTPFEEIRRLAPTEELVLTDARPRVAARRWSWAEADERLRPASAVAPDLVAQLRSTLAGVAGPVTVPLSGGMDSRLLLATTPRDRLAGTVTVDTDAGTGSDQDLAAAVAAAFEVPHRSVPPEHDRPYEDDAAAVADALEHQTSLHPWFLTLVRALQGPGAVVDGLAGLLMKGNFRPRVRDEDPDPSAARWRILAPSRDLGGIVRPEAAAWWRGCTGEAVEAAYARFEEHPAGANLAAYTTRTIRGVSLSPVHLLASRHPTLVPFTDTAFATTALGVDPDDRDRGELYRALLDGADRRAAALPTTADDVERVAVAARRELQPTTQTWYRDLLLDDRVRPLLDPGFVLRLAAGRTPGLFLHRPQRYAVRGLALLSRWLERHADVLADVEPPGELRTPRRPWAADAPAPWRDPWLEQVEASRPPGRTLRLWWQGRLRGELVEAGEVRDAPAELDATTLPAGPIDLVVLDDVLRHLDDPLAFEVALTRVLAEDGTLAVSSAWPFGDDRPQPDDVVASVARVVPPTVVTLGRGRVRVAGRASGGDERARLGPEATASLAARRTDEYRAERREREREAVAHDQRTAALERDVAAGERRVAELTAARDDLDARLSSTVQELDRARARGDDLHARLVRLRSGRWWRLGELLRGLKARPTRVLRLPLDLARLLRGR